MGWVDLASDAWWQVDIKFCWLMHGCLGFLCVLGKWWALGTWWLLASDHGRSKEITCGASGHGHFYVSVSRLEISRWAARCALSVEF